MVKGDSPILPSVLLQILGSYKAFLAGTTFEWLHFGMAAHVDLQVGLAKDLLSAHYACHRLLLAVDGPLVHAQDTVECKLLIASVAWVVLLLHVLLHVAQHAQL